MSDFDEIKSIQDFPSLIRYLRKELGWPVDEEQVDDLTFDYSPAELGLDDQAGVKIRAIKQLRPLTGNQPWGIFWIDFEPRKLPVVVMRRILGALVVRKRGGKNDRRMAWNLNDLMFISATGEGEERGISFAHFQQEAGDLPTLRVLGWDGADTLLKLDYTALTLQERLRWPADPHDSKAWREQWSSIFRHRLGHVIRTADALADRLALLARGIRNASMTLMEHESEQGPLHRLYKAFQTALIHDLTEADFADTYAQTVTYGLLTAAISRTDMTDGTQGTALVAENITDMVPITNPFLSEMLQTFLKVGGSQGGINFDELGVQDVVELLRGDETDLPAILRDFGNKKQGGDPVIYFYEHFLTSYNKKIKIQRGIFYTPQPVVSYIVRSVHELLQKEFGLEDGLADTTTWGELEKRIKGLTRPATAKPDSPFVMVLDPATGTATFLVEVIDIIYKTMTAKWEMQGLNKSTQQKSWNEYVPKHLLPRLYGYELMMAPYAIAHMKIGLKLHETGYHFFSDERVRIYLTNSLEEPSPLAEQSAASLFEALGHEAQAVNDVKRKANFTVVIGNPPYSYMSANLTDSNKSIVEPFRYIEGEKIKERGALVLERALQDDYVKYFGLAFQLINLAKIGIVGMISNGAYLTSPQLRGVRYYITKSFNRFMALDLHGDVKNLSENDQNVFDIRTGVAIFLAGKFPSKEVFQCVISDLTGSRTEKEKKLNSSTIVLDSNRFFVPQSPQYIFSTPSNTNREYADYISVADIFLVTSVGIKTNRDHLTIGYDDSEIDHKIQILINPKYTTAQVSQMLEIEDNAQWAVAEGRRQCKLTYSKENYRHLTYRPFDNRRIYYHPSIVFNPRPAVMNNLLEPGNLALLTNRRIRTETHCHFGVIDKLCMAEFLSSADNCNVYPLWLFENSLLRDYSKRPNFNPNFLKLLSKQLRCRQEGQFGLPQNTTPEDIFYNMYAIFHSPTYRSRYAEFLKIDFPHLPLTSNLDLFRSLTEKGAELVSLHLLDGTIFDFRDSIFAGHPSPVVGKGYPRHENNTVWVNPESGFMDVSQDVWEFHIGGYQVCHKWLKDRRGRQLSQEDITHYQKITIALRETIRLMGEVDEVIDYAGGWPIK
jgi:hypothetical protein